jgi:Zn-dependent alcohol dehydrogenase
MLADLYDRGELPLQQLQTTFKVSDIDIATEQMMKGLVIKPVLLWGI